MVFDSPVLGERCAQKIIAMLRNKLYYGIKPWVPVSVRLAVRRWLAHQTRAGINGVWPVLPGSERPPERWTGWPEGKKFAFILTHDVESQSGLAKTKSLMELEMRLGFRSSFNLIPEGITRFPLNCAWNLCVTDSKWGCTIFTTTANYIVVARSLP
jgi:hypothetical protein